MWYWFVPLPSQKTAQPGPAEHHVYTSNLELTLISSLGGIGHMLVDAWSLSCVEHDTEHLKRWVKLIVGKDGWLLSLIPGWSTQRSTIFSAIVQPTFNVGGPLVPWLQPHPTTQIKDTGYNRLERTAGYQTVLLPRWTSYTYNEASTSSSLSLCNVATWIHCCWDNWALSIVLVDIILTFLPARTQSLAASVFWNS